MICSKPMQKYFDSLIIYTNKAYKLAQECRKQGYDPRDYVEVSLAKNAAERVVGLISIIAPQIKGSGVTKRIVNLEQKYGVSDWRVAFIIAHEIAQQKYCKFKDELEAIQVGVKTGFAYVTQGIVSSPLEGLTKIELVDRQDGQGTYFRLSYAGPIRSAGGTMGSVSVLIADYVRKKMGYVAYDPTEKEANRIFAEWEDYNSYITNLQYFPSKEEGVFLGRNIPVQLIGEPSERYELSSALLKDLPRVPSNILSSGFSLITAECLSLKAPKLWKQLSKWGKEFDMEQWNFLEEFIEIQKKSKALGQKAEEHGSEKITPNFTYVKDIVAGRPVLGYPMKPGAFRLRYGRARVSGYSAQAISPASMQVLNGFVALGTQLKVERPGKGTAVMSTDYIDGPIVKLKDGSVLFLETEEQAKEVNKDVEEILFNGDILVNYGDFLDRAHILAPAGYCQEFWILEFEKKVVELFGSMDFDKLSGLLNISANSLKKLFDDPIKTKISARAAFKISRILDIPLHPRYDFYWSTISKDDLINLFSLVQKLRIEEDETHEIKSVIFSLVDKAFMKGKRTLEILGIPHLFVNNEYVVLDKNYGYALLEVLNISSKEDYVFLLKELAKELDENFSALSFVNKISHVFLRDKAGIFIGSRMGRPEKAKMRKLKGTPHGLFPIGKEGGKLRSFQSAMNKNIVTAEFHIFWCDTCKRETIFGVCEKCGKKCKTFDLDSKDDDKKKFPETFKPVKRSQIPVRDYVELFRKKIGFRMIPDLIKGVRGTFHDDHYCEHISKALLRAKHKIYVNKDGTTRYDCSEMSLTHFKPKEIMVSIEKLIGLGYEKDIYGNQLVDDNQILELKAQDIVIPACPDSPEDESNKVLFKVAKFIDELMKKLYNAKPFYNLKDMDDLVGHLIVGLAPHTSAGIVGRIIGFSKTQTFLAHPLYHAAMRRDCFTYNTLIPIKKGSAWEVIELGKVVEDLNPIEVVDNYGTKEIKVKGYKTLGLKNNKICEVNINNFTKHSPRKIIEIKTKLGREIKTTIEHKHIIFDKKNSKNIILRANELQKGDLLKLPYNLKIKKKDIKVLDLIELFKNYEWLMIKGLSKQISNLRTQLKGLKLNKSQINNYILRDSLPIKYAYKLILLNKKRVNKSKLFISAKRDNVKLPSKIEVNSKFLKIIGLYIAEGYSRKNTSKKGFYQVYIAAQNIDVRNFITNYFINYLGLKPSENKKDRVTFSSKILYYLITDILKCGSSAYEKRIPAKFLTLPNNKLGNILSGYFEGDGSVSKTDLRLTFDTVSKRLLRDLDFVLGQIGIFIKNKQYKKEPGNKVKEFYIKKQLPIPKFSCIKGTIQSKFMKKLYNHIRFISNYKQDRFDFIIINKHYRNLFLDYNNNFFFDEIISIKVLPEECSYCLNVDNNIVIANGILTRQCDGDESCFLLLMDALLNFSVKYLPTSRGSTQDAPLVLTTLLDPSEVDDMAFNVDRVSKYPLEFYMATLEYKYPWDVKIETINDVLGTEQQFEGMGFTHDSRNINDGVLCSSYKVLPTMQDKLDAQLDLAKKIRAVDEMLVAKLVIEKHFIRDTKGNLRKFSMQIFRCANCNAKFRRPPLRFNCPVCKTGKVIFTISEGSVIKYLASSLRLAEEYNVPLYLKETLNLLQLRVDDVFGKEKEKQTGLGEFFT